MRMSVAWLMLDEELQMTHYKCCGTVPSKANTSSRAKSKVRKIRRQPDAALWDGSDGGGSGEGTVSSVAAASGGRVDARGPAGAGPRGVSGTGLVAGTGIPVRLRSTTVNVTGTVNRWLPFATTETLACRVSPTYPGTPGT